MAFCSNCGAEVSDAAVVCVKCGVALNGKSVGKSESWSTGGFIGLVIASFIIPLIGIGCGIYGITKPEKRGQGGILLGCAGVGMILWAAIS